MRFRSPSPTAESAPADDSTSILFLLASWVLLWLPLMLFVPSDLNQDTFQYLAIANNYLQSPNWSIHSAHTVGPVIPGILGLCKWMFSFVCVWTADADVALVKGLALACYVAVTVSAIRVCRTHGVNVSVAGQGLCLAAFSLPVGIDTFSLNGELVCCAFFAAFLAISTKPLLRGWDQAMLVLLAVLILYTKLQAILLLGWCFFVCFSGRTRWRLVLAFLGTVILVEFALAFTGGGWTPKFAPLLDYIQHSGEQLKYVHPLKASNSPNFYNVFTRQILLLQWIVQGTVYYFPFISAGVLIGFTKGRVTGIQQWIATGWLVVTVLTVIIPARKFDHYLLLFIPLFLVLTPHAIRRLELKPTANKIAFPAVVAMIVLKFGAMMPTSDFFDRSRGLYVVPRLVITPSALKLRESAMVPPGDTMFVHGWDYRYYSYFNKNCTGPEIAFVHMGTLTAEQYLRDLLNVSPTYILDAVRHTGLIRDSALSIDGNPAWKKPINQRYDKIFEEDGLVLFRLRTNRTD